MNSSQIGNIGEVKVLSKFVELGVPVYLPYGDGYEIDMIAIFNDKTNRIQVKTTEKIHDNGVMQWKITKQDGYHGSRTKYNEGVIDYFALYCIEANVLCLVPFEDARMGLISIRLDSYEGIRSSTMRFVKDFQFEKFINV
jgi:hypothetical protein